MFYTLCIFVCIFVILLTVILNIQEAYDMESDAVSTIEQIKNEIDHWQTDWENLKYDLKNPDKWDFPEFSPEGRDKKAYLEEQMRQSQNNVRYYIKQLKELQDNNINNTGDSSILGKRTSSNVKDFLPNIDNKRSN